ncbi:MAG: hypothetical protein ABI818_10330 [Acidobacteriota bacterium]
MVKKAVVVTGAARRFEDLKAAYLVIGDSAVSRLTWIAQFAREDPSTWQSGTRAAHGNCILALTGFLFPPNLVGGPRIPPPLPPEDVDEVHRALKRAMHDLVNNPAGEPVDIPTDAVSVAVVRVSGVHEKPAKWGTVLTYTSPLAVLHALKDLVLVAGDRLVACRYCAAPFVAFKKQEFCGEQCAQKSRNEKKAAKKAGRKS